MLIPVKVVPAPEVASRSGVGAPDLAVTSGAEDELPQGPTGFDVLRDGRFVITDPLRRRLAVFSGEGEYVSQRVIGFAAENVTSLSDGQLEVVDAHSGESRRVEGFEGGQVASPPAGQTDMAVEMAGKNRAVVRGAATKGTGAALDIVLDDQNQSLVSVQSLGGDSAGNIYVALEISEGGAVVAVTKRIRKYSSDGTLLAEIVDIPLDYYVHPAQEFRIRGGMVYQMVPAVEHLTINVWDVR